jgi:hypothetical protein
MITRNGRAGDDIEEAIEMVRRTFAAYCDDRQRSAQGAPSPAAKGEKKAGMYPSLCIIFVVPFKALEKADQPKQIATIFEIVDELSPFTVANDSVAKDFYIECLSSVPGIPVESSKLWKSILLLRAIRRMESRNWKAAADEPIQVVP